ncbi:hypothetical protein PHISCL_08660 [Aspergillus sclerotialis]|uniref:Uncharacterized protein n=1 Tax=Aspergillus sclerotialis TaxID=2070753 RepID=A0A3A2Z7B9_9EURO|nr:hypothetical protein PHISCL_08660 [Aspergillus sclerotialis]
MSLAVPTSPTTKPGSEGLFDEDLKGLEDLTPQQEQDIIDKVLNIPSENTSDFITSLERNIVPEGFGLSISDLEKLFHKEKWIGCDSNIRSKAQRAFERVERVGNLIFEESGRDYSQKDVIFINEDTKRHTDTQGQNKLNDEQKLEIIEQINKLSSDDYTEFVKALETSIVPEGFGLTLMDIQVVVHPDKWVNSSPEMRNKAQTAFARVEKVIDEVEKGVRSGDVNKKNWIYHRSESDIPELDGPPVIGGLRAFHFTMHKKATGHLRTLAAGVAHQDKQPHQDGLEKARKALSEINKEIERFNRQNEYPAELGTIHTTTFEGQWRALLSQGNVRPQKVQHALARLCKTSHYPVGWAYIPPADSQCYFASENYWCALSQSFAKELGVWYNNSLYGPTEGNGLFKEKLRSFYKELTEINKTYGKDLSANKGTFEHAIRLLDELVSHARNGDRPGFSQKRAEIMHAIEMGNYPNEWLPPDVDEGYWASRPKPASGAPPIPPAAEQSTKAGSAATSGPHGVNGRLKVISVRPRMVKRCIEPGKTATGEPIRYIQKLGDKRANFVVEGADGSYRLVSSASAGGLPAIEGAQKSGVPFTVQKEEIIQDYKARVRKGGEYGCFFVAIGEWDLAKRRLPFIVVGFHHSDGATEVNEAISRSSLGKILSPKMAERMIVEGIVGHPNMSLEEVMHYQISLAAPLTNYHLEPQPAQTTPWQTGHAQPDPFEQRMSLPWGEPEPLWFQKPRSKSKQSQNKSYMYQPQHVQPMGFQGQSLMPQHAQPMPQHAMGFTPQLAGFAAQQPFFMQAPSMGYPNHFMPTQFGHKTGTPSMTVPDNTDTESEF